MDVNETKQDGVLILAPQGRLDSNTAPVFEKTLLAAIDRGDNRVVLDFSDLDYISSSGLRVLLMGAKKAKAARGDVRLCHLKPSIREVFEISGFLSIFAVDPDRASAVAAA